MPDSSKAKAIVYPPRHTGPITIKICSTDQDVIELMRERSGVGLVSGPYSPNGFGKKPYYEWRANGRAAVDLLWQMRPWLGERRRAQMDAKYAQWTRRPRRDKKVDYPTRCGIRTMHARGFTYEAIARMYKISLCYVGQICRRTVDIPPTYVSGPMSGLPDNNYPAFMTASTELRDAGQVVVNPAELPEPEEEQDWDWYLRRDIVALVSCGRVAMLPGWQNSRGAQLEHHIARELGMEITYPEGESPSVAA